MSGFVGCAAQVGAEDDILQLQEFGVDLGFVFVYVESGGGDRFVAVGGETSWRPWSSAAVEREVVVACEKKRAR